MSLQCGHKVCVWRTDSPDDGRIGIVIRITNWYGEPVATVQFIEVGWDQTDLDHFYLSELIRV